MPLPTSFFFSLTPPPPRSTLFPYTTLFRSHIEGRTPTHAETEAGLERIREMEAQWIIRVTIPDRKSTRLNSSHRCISYAVFCLKKKKKKKKIRRQSTMVIYH